MVAQLLEHMEPLPSRSLIRLPNFQKITFELNEELTFRDNKQELNVCHMCYTVFPRHTVFPCKTYQQNSPKNNVKLSCIKKSFCVKIFPALQVHTSDFHRKTSHFICLKGNTTFINLLLAKLYCSQ
jgi:hypothetical protein